MKMLEVLNKVIRDILSKQNAEENMSSTYVWVEKKEENIFRPKKNIIKARKRG